MLRDVIPHNPSFIALEFIKKRFADGLINGSEAVQMFLVSLQVVEVKYWSDLIVAKASPSDHLCCFLSNSTSDTHSDFFFASPRACLTNQRSLKMILYEEFAHLELVPWRLGGAKAKLTAILLSC